MKNLLIIVLGLFLIGCGQQKNYDNCSDEWITIYEEHHSDCVNNCDKDDVNCFDKCDEFWDFLLK